MSLESKIEALTQALVALTAKLESANVAAPAPVAQAPAPVVAPAPLAQPAAAAPVSVIPTNPVSSQPAAPAMPAPPTFEAPAPAPVASAVPFHDGKSLIDYVMGVYKVLGPQKGAGIQNVLTSLGYQNINDVKSEHYAALHAGIEALKG